MSEQHLATLPADAVKEHLRPIRAMTQLLIARGKDAGSARPSDGGGARGEGRAFFQSARAKLKTAFGKKRPCQSDRYVRNGYRRFLRVLSRDPGSLRFRLCAWWYYIA